MGNIVVSEVLAYEWRCTRCGAIGSPEVFQSFAEESANEHYCPED